MGDRCRADGDDGASYGAVGLWSVNEYGYLSSADIQESPNQNERPAGTKIQLLVIHCISLPPGKYGGVDVKNFFLNKLDPSDHPYFRGIANTRVSAHFFICRKGLVTQFVSCLRRAWHAGHSIWRGKSGCNDFSIGIELEGTDKSVFTEAQYGSLAKLSSILVKEYRIQDIVSHGDIARPIGRKTDPGAFFNWDKYRTMMEAD